MAKMIGKTLKFRQCSYLCCGIEIDKHTAKVREKAEAFRYEEAAEEQHPDGLCQDPKSGMLGCKYCYGDDYDHYDNAELDDVPGVWCNTDWRNDPDYIRAMKEEGIWGTR